MKFGPVSTRDAWGAVLAHSVQSDGGRLRKGKVLEAADLERLSNAGIVEVVVARLDPDDVPENEAAARLARALVPEPEGAGITVTEAFTGRVNLLANGPGVARIDAEVLHRLNRLDPMLTCATVAPLTRMAAKGMVATIKVISYAVPEAVVAEAEALAIGAIGLHPVALKTAALIVTHIGAERGGEEKGVAAIRTRLQVLGMELTEVAHVGHSADEIAGGLKQADADLVLVLTGSATSDVADVAPEAVRQAGGQVTRFGMPVDPGNLLFLGELAGRPVIGLPGCARSPALNGADWVLERVVCGLDVTDDDIAGMGVGGLLKEIPQRPLPRQPKTQA